MKKRYEIVEGSQSFHCCFEYTVVDTSNPRMIAGEHYENKYDGVCECFDKESAELICNALNKADEA